VNDVLNGSCRLEAIIEEGYGVVDINIGLRISRWGGRSSFITLREICKHHRCEEEKALR